MKASLRMAFEIGLGLLFGYVFIILLNVFVLVPFARMLAFAGVGI